MPVLVHAIAAKTYSRAKDRSGSLTNISQAAQDALRCTPVL